MLCLALLCMFSYYSAIQETSVTVMWCGCYGDLVPRVLQARQGLGGSSADGARRVRAWGDAGAPAADDVTRGNEGDAGSFQRTLFITVAYFRPFLRPFLRSSRRRPFAVRSAPRAALLSSSLPLPRRPSQPRHGQQRRPTPFPPQY